ncbi:MAG: hypothetical protein ABL914_13200 [Novosphingobium sp.]|uniref:hypothetical protein n=1 Tax=Novosphingobium sp. TaxID=1874826 RepID=UPI0032BBD660
MKTISKSLIGTVAAGAMAITSASPAFAGHRDRDGVSVGDVIAGALIIGGIVAVASAADNDRDYRGYEGYNGYRGDRRGHDDDRRWRGNPRQAVEQCVHAAERYAASRYGRADVVDIREVRDTRNGFEVKGRIAVGGGRDRSRGWRNGGGYYNDGYYNNNNGNNHNNGNHWGGNYGRGDDGSFKCKFERGRIADLDIDGIRGL